MRSEKSFRHLECRHVTKAKLIPEFEFHRRFRSHPHDFTFEVFVDATIDVVVPVLSRMLLELTQRLLHGLARGLVAQLLAHDLENVPQPGAVSMEKTNKFKPISVF